MRIIDRLATDGHHRVSPSRVRELDSDPLGSGLVIYWMQRDFRADDNWALLFAQSLAIDMNQSLLVAVTVPRQPDHATLRQFDFWLNGLEETVRDLQDLRIPTLVSVGEPGRQMLDIVRKHQPGAVVTDTTVLRAPREWTARVAKSCDVAMFEVDAHNVVPVWQASDKKDYAAYTIRSKINRVLSEYLTDFPELVKHPVAFSGGISALDTDAVRRRLNLDSSVAPIEWLTPGPSVAAEQLERFLARRLQRYDKERNDPTRNAQSDLSPFLHFGQIAPQRVALAAQRFGDELSGSEAFLEELIIRRELSDNFCYYEAAYDSFEGLPEWGQKTLDEHRSDPRPYLYDREQFEQAGTHDPLWNAAQSELVQRGKMHGYMRMYWAKKILEWSASPEDALSVAIYLNDRYSLDGSDPNGYAGIGWSIGGLHDRPWFERDIYGKVRYMSYNGCKRKFDIGAYITANTGLPLEVEK